MSDPIDLGSLLQFGEKEIGEMRSRREKTVQVIKTMEALKEAGQKGLDVFLEDARALLRSTDILLTRFKGPKEIGK